MKYTGAHIVTRHDKYTRSVRNGKTITSCPNSPHNVIIIHYGLHLLPSKSLITFRPVRWGFQRTQVR